MALIRTCRKSAERKGAVRGGLPGHYEIAKLLLERGAFPNPPVESSGDALWIAREWRPDRRIEELPLSYGATPETKRPDEDWPTREYNWLRISRCIRPPAMAT